MALYLRNFLHDYALLPFPASASHAFHFNALLNLADELHTISGTHASQTTIPLQTWLNLAHRHLGLTECQSLVYFETFTSLLAHHHHDAPDEKEHPDRRSEIPAPHLLLLLFNQLYNRDSLNDSTVMGDEFPSQIQHPHLVHQRRRPASPARGGGTDHTSPGSSGVSSTSSSAESSPSLPGSRRDRKTHENHQQHHKAHRFPPDILEGHHHLASFWRSTALKWLSLIFVALHGRHIDPHPSTDPAASSASHGVIESLELDMNGLGIVDFLFTAVGPGEGTEERASLKREFKEWMTTGAERDTEEGEGVTMGTGDYKCERVATLFKDFCEGMAGFDSGKGLVSLGLLDRWVSWTAKDRPLLYRKLKCSENGVAYALKDMKGASLADDDDDGFEVLISHKRAQSIVIHPYYTSTHATLHIHRCHDTHIYVLGPLRNLTLSHCRGTTVAVGAVSESLTLNRCDRVSVSGACRRVVVKGCEDSKVNVWVETKPMFVDECGGRKSKGVTLAPCNIWYNGMKVHLEEAGLGGKSNMWDQPVVVWDVVEPAVGDVELSGGGKGETAETETPGKHAFSLLPPTSFFCNELPFDFPSLDAVPLTAPAADGTSSPSRLTSTPNPLPLPPAYAARTSSYENHALRARHIVESATAADPATKAEFQRKIETEFHAWMRKTGRIGEVCSLVAAGRDMDKMRQIVESKGPRDDNNNTEDDDDELVMMDIEEPQHSENGKLRIGNVTVF